MHLLSEGSRLRIYHLAAAGVRLQIVLFFCADFSNKSHCFHYLWCIILYQSCTHEVSIFISSGVDKVPLNYRQVRISK